MRVRTTVGVRLIIRVSVGVRGRERVSVGMFGLGLGFEG
jgi:hypothetical protein